MCNLAIRIAELLEAIEQERGKFKVKCLVAQYPDDVHWDLILWAEWFEPDEKQRLDYLIKKIINPLDYNLMNQFNAIITFDPDDNNEFLRSLLKIQDNYLKGRYQGVYNSELIEVATTLPQARLVIPLTRLPVDTRLEALA